MMACQSLTGIDAFYWFNHDGVEYQLEPYHSYSKVTGQYGLHKWKLPPAIETMFPAAALAYRMGYVGQAKPVLLETRKLDDLWPKATTLDTAGFPRGKATLARTGSAVKLTFPADAIWVVMER